MIGRNADGTCEPKLYTDIVDPFQLRLELDGLERDNLHLDPGCCRQKLLKKGKLITKLARQSGMPELIASSLIQEARILIAMNQDDTAKKVLAEAYHIIEKVGKHNLGIVILSKLAEISSRNQDWQAVLQICQTGIELIERHRYNVTPLYLQSSYMRSRISLYSLGVRAAYELQDFLSAIEWADISKCRSILGYQKSNHLSIESTEITGQELRMQYRDNECLEGKESEERAYKRRILWDLFFIEQFRQNNPDSTTSFNLESLQLSLDQDEGILYYYWLDRLNLMIITITRENWEIELRPISLDQRNELESIAQYILGLKDINYNRLEGVRRLSSVLLPSKGRSLILHKQRLLISPHRVLHAIPFHALEWNSGFLIQEFAITYVPNLSSLLFNYVPLKKRNVLAIGIKDYRIPGRQLSTLPHAEKEVDSIKELYEGNTAEVTVLKGENGVIRKLYDLDKLGALQRYWCIHLAVHGENIDSDNPIESRLFLGNSVLDGLDIASLKLDAELVVLSACCSGQQPISGRGMNELPGDDMFGLQAAFFAAGAKRILGTLWPVISQDAYQISLTFHRNLANGIRPEIALQAAIKEYLRTAGILSQKIANWAPFFLSAIGRPNVHIVST